ncbi:4195_t:CDS:2 [Acaulospora colombiana]|uniref:4195_t:CDS:1 n=1 Tax=Acaulospora colombiana TaxID=27376 RepID=A0ACA9K8P5_9GLOM|nr:4195_t:CDS:2 [Acaulospora colombiana]
MDNDYKRDLQNLILRMCRMVFHAIQEGTYVANLRTMKQKMFHGDISSKCDLDQFIGTFKSAKYLPYVAGVHYDPISTVTFDFNWEIKEHKENMDNLISISKVWYIPFLEYVGKMHRWRYHCWRDVTESSPHAEELLNGIMNHLPGFRYLYDFHWNATLTSSFQQPQEPCVLLLASECGVFAIVVVKFRSRNGDNGLYHQYHEWVKAYKIYAAEKHGNKCLSVIGATYTSDPEVSEPLEFVDELDYSIALSVQSSSSEQRFTSHSNVKTILPWMSKPTENVLQAAQSHFRKMPINPGKCAAVVGTEWIYEGGNTDSDYEEYDLNDDYGYYYDNGNYY